MELYHNNMSVCAQKVRLVVHEKRLNPVEHHMLIRNGDVHTPEYLLLNPKGVVPTLIDHGEAIIESTIICEYLEEAYPELPLLPKNPVERSKVRRWTLLPDAGLHNAASILSVVVAWREQMIAHGSEQMSNRPNYGDSNDQLKDSIELGLDYDRVPPTIRVFDDAIAKIAKALEHGSPWICGDMYTLADTSMLPYVCRLDDLNMSWFWDDRPAVGEWLERARARPNYSGIKDYLVPEYVDLCKERGREASPLLRAML